jgi:hypothetical protein
MRTIANPYGIEYTGRIVRVEGGDRYHVFDKRTGGGLCGAGLGRTAGKVVASTGKKMDCLRCIKILYVDHAQKYLVERSFKPSAPGKRSKHLMIAGGREGQAIGRKESKIGTAKKPFGPERVERFVRGTSVHPTQTRLASKRKPAARVSRQQETAMRANPLAIVNPKRFKIGDTVRFTDGDANEIGRVFGFKTKSYRGKLTKRVQVRWEDGIDTDERSEHLVGVSVRNNPLAIVNPKRFKIGDKVYNTMGDPGTIAGFETHVGKRGPTRWPVVRYAGGTSYPENPKHLSTASEYRRKTAAFGKRGTKAIDNYLKSRGVSVKGKRKNPLPHECAECGENMYFLRLKPYHERSALDDDHRARAVKTTPITSKQAAPKVSAKERGLAKGQSLMAHAVAALRQERGLAKGQSLMARAAAAYRRGEYKSVKDAMQGLSGKKKVANPRRRR